MGASEFDGDLEKVYRAAWREAEEADREVAKVLITLSFVEGRIEPELLAACLSSLAVDKAFTIAHHLINQFQSWLADLSQQLSSIPAPAEDNTLWGL
ncbi:MAG: hypothetical protein U5K56_12935 [Halioglobus sp.]|nr:hypothetical protein [Halioglobus sp.]